MPMTVEQSNAANELLEALTGAASSSGGKPRGLDPERLAWAAGILARGANRTLGAGFSEQRAVDAVRTWLRTEAAPASPAADAWSAAAADAITRAVGGATVKVLGTHWAADAEDADGEPTPSGVLYLVAEPDGRQVTIQLSATLVEGDPS